MKKIYVLIGNFGSGKTELALHFAFLAAKTGKTELIDLDMVNTYFRLTEHKATILEQGIRLISPNYALTNVETLSLPAEVASAFHMDWDTVVFDVGGDGAGATALGRFREYFAELSPEQLEVLNVINVRRPMSDTADKILHLQEELERNARLSVTGYINNTNLQHETTAAELRDGYEILRELSQRTGIPVAYTSGVKEHLDVFLAEKPDMGYVGTPVYFQRRMRRDWDSYVNALRD